MSKLAIILSVVILASPAICNFWYVPCADELEFKIQEHKVNIQCLRNAAFQEIDDKLNSSQFNDEIHRNIPTETSNWGPPKLEFSENSDSYVIKYTPEIDDSQCRRYLRTFTDKQINRCTGFLLYKMSVGQDEIKREADNAIKYFDRILMSTRNISSDYQAETLARSCVNKMRDFDYVAKVTEGRIKKILHHSLAKMNNYVRDLSECLITQVKGVLETYNEWHRACSYYTEA